MCPSGRLSLSLWHNPWCPAVSLRALCLETKLNTPSHHHLFSWSSPDPVVSLHISMARSSASCPVSSGAAQPGLHPRWPKLSGHSMHCAHFFFSLSKCCSALLASIQSAQQTFLPNCWDEYLTPLPPASPLHQIRDAKLGHNLQSAATQHWLLISRWGIGVHISSAYSIRLSSALLGFN